LEVRGTVNVEESCEIASLEFSARAWKEVNVSPKDSWFKQHVISAYSSQETKSSRNFAIWWVDATTCIKDIVFAYKPVLKIRVSAAMKQEFITRSANIGYKSLKNGPFVFNRVEFNQLNRSNASESYEMTIECRTQEPQVIGRGLIGIEFTGSPTEIDIFITNYFHLNT